MSCSAELRKEEEGSGSALHVEAEPLTGKPFFHVILQKSHIASALVIPAKMARILPSSIVRAELDHGNKKWKTTYLGSHKTHKRFDVLGWKTFVADNKLVVGDACLFELMENEGSMIKFKVQILRGDFPPELLTRLEGTKDKPLVIE